MTMDRAPKGGVSYSSLFHCFITRRIPLFFPHLVGGHGSRLWNTAFSFSEEATEEMLLRFKSRTLDIYRACQLESKTR